MSEASVTTPVISAATPAWKPKKTWPKMGLTYREVVDWENHCAAIVPCLNEKDSIGSLVTRLRARLPSVIVVDDHSLDQTREIARMAGATVIVNQGQPGKGSALRLGLESAAAAGFSWAICLDGDGQHSPDMVGDFFSKADATKAKLVIGNRMSSSAAQMTVTRRLTNQLMSWILSRSTGVHFPDSQCGYRLVHIPSVLELGLSTARFEIESEMVVKAAQAGLPVSFVEIPVIPCNRRSRIQPLLDTWRWLRWFLAWRGSPAPVTQSSSMHYERIKQHG